MLPNSRLIWRGRWSARAGLGRVPTVAPLSGRDGGGAHHQLARSLGLSHRAVSPERPHGHFVPLGHIALRRRRCSFALGRRRRLREMPRRQVLPLAQATAAVRHRPRPVPWLQTPSRAAARRPGWRCPRPGPKAVPDVVGSAVAPQAAGLGRSEVPAKQLGCGKRRGGVHRSSRSRRARIASGRSVARVYMQPVSLRSGLSGGLYTGYYPAY